MPRYYLTDDQARRIDRLLDWYERVGRHLGPPPPPLRGLGEPIPMELARAKARIAPTLYGTTADWAASTGGKLRPLRVGSSGSLERDTGSTYHGYDVFGVGAQPDEIVHVLRHRQSGRRDFFAMPGQRCYGYVNSTSTGGVSSTDATFPVDRIEPLWGASPTSSSAATLSVTNSFQWTIANGQLVAFEWNKSGSRWETYQANGCT